MDEQVKLAFEFAKSLGEQLITLSTGILALSITFTKDIIARVPPRTTAVLGFAWLLYLISILCGLDHLMALTGQLAPVAVDKAATSKDGTPGTTAAYTAQAGTTAATDATADQERHEKPPKRVYGIGSLPRAAMARQVITFGLATAITLLYGFLALRYRRTTTEVPSAAEPPLNAS